LAVARPCRKEAVDRSTGPLIVELDRGALISGDDHRDELPGWARPLHDLGSMA